MRNDSPPTGPRLTFRGRVACLRRVDMSPGWLESYDSAMLISGAREARQTRRKLRLDFCSLPRQFSPQNRGEAKIDKISFPTFTTFCSSPDPPLTCSFLPRPAGDLCCALASLCEAQLRRLTIILMRLPRRLVEHRGAPKWIIIRCRGARLPGWCAQKSNPGEEVEADEGRRGAGNSSGDANPFFIPCETS